MTTPTITAFESSPDRGRGLARDMPVRWALEEVGQRYDVRLVSFAEMKQPAHLKLQPFGQIPTYEDGDLALFESAAIVLHIAEQHPGLLPDDANGRARAIAWMFAAKSTVEPPIVEREAAILLEKDKSWFEARMPILDERVRVRLGQLSAALGDSDWLDGDFSAGDLLMVNVLRRPAASPMLQEFPNLVAYVARGEARPAFKRAFEAQHAVFLASSAARPKITNPGGSMALTLFGHPFSSYTQKALIALYADGTDFEYRTLDVEQPEPFFAELKGHWPFGKFPVLIDDGKAIIETSCIIEHLQAHHPGPNEWIPDGDLGRRARFLDRFFDLYVMENMQKIATDPLRPEESRDSNGVEKARANLNTAYDWIEGQLGEPWAAGKTFTLADCAAAPSLFYADWVEPIGDARPKLAAYRARLLAHPPVSRCVEEGRPYRHFFPLGAPDRD